MSFDDLPIPASLRVVLYRKQKWQRAKGKGETRAEGFLGLEESLPNRGTAPTVRLVSA